MPEYHRAQIEGGTFFFTVVSYHRLPIFISERSRSLLRLAWANTSERYPFKTEAICLLPDHLHCIWTLPPGDSNYSLRWGEIKRIFSKAYLENGSVEGTRNDSRRKRGEAAVWQRRFWEHTIQDEHDLTAHLNYIHYNPVRHGLVKSVADWPWSSFHRFVKMEYYDQDWGSDVGEKIESLICGE